GSGRAFGLRRPRGPAARDRSRAARRVHRLDRGGGGLDRPDRHLPRERRQPSLARARPIPRGPHPPAPRLPPPPLAPRHIPPTAQRHRRYRPGLTPVPPGVLARLAARLVASLGSGGARVTPRRRVTAGACGP